LFVFGAEFVFVFAFVLVSVLVSAFDFDLGLSPVVSEMACGFVVSSHHNTNPHPNPNPDTNSNPNPNPNPNLNLYNLKIVQFDSTIIFEDERQDK
jgi:hypothetical protein